MAWMVTILSLLAAGAAPIYPSYGPDSPRPTTTRKGMLTFSHQETIMHSDAVRVSTYTSPKMTLAPGLLYLPYVA